MRGASLCEVLRTLSQPGIKFAFLILFCPFSICEFPVTPKLSSTAFLCPAPRGLASRRSVGSKLKGVKEAIPL